MSFLPDKVNPSCLHVDRQSGITYPIRAEAVINHIFISFHLPPSSLKMSLSLTLKADLLWKQTHIPLFLPGCLLRTGNDCRELCFVPLVRLDEIHGAERNHTKQQHEHTQPLDGVPHPEVHPSPQKLQPTIRPLWTTLHQDHPTQQMLPQRASSKKTLPSRTNAQKRTGTAQRVWLFAPTVTQALLHMHRFANFC